jgi:hypothetical protein
MRLSLVLAFLLGLLAMPSSLHAEVLIVDDDGSGDFLDMPSAVNAAAEGDIILVRAPHVTAFTLFAKSLTIVGIPSGEESPTVHGELIIAGLTAHQQVVLSTLQLQGNVGPPGYTGGVALTVVDSEGLVSLWHCDLRGGPGSAVGSDLPQPGGIALIAYSVASVALSSCTLVGGSGSATVPQAGDGGIGMSVASASVFLAQTSVEGGVGGGDIATTATGGAGGAGLLIELGTLFTGGLDVVLRGGDGGAGSAQWGDGGAGAVLDSFSLVRVRGGAPQGGDGAAATSSSAADGKDGQALVTTGGVLDTLPGVVPEFTGLDAFALPGETISFSVSPQGSGSGAKLLLASLEATAAYIGGQKSPLLVQGPWIAGGLLMPKGVLAVQLPPLPAGLDGVTVLVQAWAQGVGLSNAQVLTLLATSPGP